MSNPLKIAGGFKLPPDGALTENELAWVEFLRIASNNGDPRPTLATIQALRRLFEPEEIAP